MDKFNLANKVAVVTGAAGLLGAQHCRALLECKANLVITDISKQSCDSLQITLRDEFPELKIEVFAMDVTSEKSINNCLEFVLQKFGKIDVLINNAAIDPKVKSEPGVLEESRFENFPVSSWNFQISVGLTGAFLCSKVFGIQMAKQKSGVILNIASDLAVIAPDQRIYRKQNLEDSLQPVKPVTYSVIKSGLVGLTKYLATYWANDGIRVNALSPGGVYNGQPEEFVSKLRSLIPLNRMAAVDEYHGCIQFLCSDASNYITGQNIVADGGRSVW